MWLTGFDPDAMTPPVDPFYFAELARQNADELCRRANCRYDAAERVYLMTAWDDEYAIHPHESRISRISVSGPTPHDFFHLFLIYYLLKNRQIEPTGEWISEKDIPGGSTFFRGPHEIPTQLISGCYGNDIEAFCRGCRRLYGRELQMADAAFRFDITPRIPVAVLYWRGDNDFPPEADLLYDRTITVHLSADIVFALAVAVCDRIAKAARWRPSP